MESFRSPTCTYIPINPIGNGTYGRVYLCKKEGTEEKYAVKILKMSKEELIELLPNYTRELTIMKALRHRNLVSFVEEFELNDKIYLVTEFCEEGDLTKYLKGRTLTEEDVMRMAGQLLEGLCFIHEQGYMHRDLKPDNIFLGEGLTVKIGDYGMSKKSEIGLHNTSQVGTPLYSSPEILQGRGEYTSKTDIFSAALIIYYMLFGNPMFREAMSIDHLKELQQRYLRPDAKEKKLATFKCSDFFRGLMGFMLELEESKRPTIFEAVEWYTKHSGVDLSCSFKKVSSKKDQQNCTQDVLHYFESLSKNISELQQNYLRLANRINDPANYRMSNLDRYILVYLLFALYLTESNSLLAKYRSEYYHGDGHLVNWNAPVTAQFQAIRQSFLEIFSKYNHQLTESFSGINQTFLDQALMSDGRWFEDVMMSAVVFREQKKYEKFQAYKVYLKAYLDCKRIKRQDYKLAVELKRLVK